MLTRVLFNRIFPSVNHYEIKMNGTVLLMLKLIMMQVQEMLRRMEYCETLFPSTKQLEKEHPTWATPQYKARVKVCYMLHARVKMCYMLHARVKVCYILHARVNVLCYPTWPTPQYKARVKVVVHGVSTMVKLIITS